MENGQDPKSKKENTMNNKWLVTGLIVAMVVLVGVIAVGAYAFTQRPFAQAYGPGWMMLQSGYGTGMTLAPHCVWCSAGVNSPYVGGMMNGRSFGRGGFSASTSLVTIASQDLNVSATDLIAQLQSGKSIADVAKDKNVSTAKIVTDFIAARTTQLKGAVDAKQITQAQADARLAWMKENLQAQLDAKGTSGSFGFGRIGPGQNFRGMRSGNGAGGMIGPRGGWR